MRSRSCTPVAVALGPRGHDVAVAVLADAAAEAVLGVVGHREQRHVGAVARAEDPRAGRRPPSRACAGSRPRPGSPSCRSTPQTPWLRALEVAPVAGGPAEVDRQPGVAAVHEVLRVAVPDVAVGVGGPAVRVDHRRHRPLRRRVARAHAGSRGSRARRTTRTRCPRARRTARGGPPAEPARGSARGSAPGVTERSSGGSGVVLVPGHDRRPPRSSAGWSRCRPPRPSRPLRRRRPRPRGRSGCAGRAPPPAASPSGCHSCSEWSAPALVSRRSPDPSRPTA